MHLGPILFCRILRSHLFFTILLYNKLLDKINTMNEFERIQLEKMIQANNPDDNTNQIRILKHSNLIKDDVQTLLRLKHEYSRLVKTNPEQFDAICTHRCSFLFNNYTDIFNKVKKDEINLSILNDLLTLLKQIEDCKVGQHEASVEVGKLLKQIYVDSALKKSEKFDKKTHVNKDSTIVKKISWDQYKNLKK